MFYHLSHSLWNLSWSIVWSGNLRLFPQWYTAIPKPFINFSTNLKCHLYMFSPSHHQRLALFLYFQLNTTSPDAMNTFHSLVRSLHGWGQWSIAQNKGCAIGKLIGGSRTVTWVRESLSCSDDLSRDTTMVKNKRSRLPTVKPECVPPRVSQSDSWSQKP